VVVQYILTRQQTQSRREVSPGAIGLPSSVVALLGEEEDSAAVPQALPADGYNTARLSPFCGRDRIVPPPLYNDDAIVPVESI